MVFNILIRFIWVWYIPGEGSDLRLRAYFFALAEMLRRWVWNFCECGIVISPVDTWLALSHAAVQG